ncbi:hypothetical protein C8F01DRAFT_1150432 [Mycena amicta]|nr:hypothetical protein C8F01DRAFT_1150432 [Mycena amicta]
MAQSVRTIAIASVALASVVASLASSRSMRASCAEMRLLVKTLFLPWVLLASLKAEMSLWTPAIDGGTIPESPCTRSPCIWSTLSSRDVVRACSMARVPRTCACRVLMRLGAVVVRVPEIGFGGAEIEPSAVRVEGAGARGGGDDGGAVSALSLPLSLGAPSSTNSGFGGWKEERCDAVNAPTADDVDVDVGMIGGGWEASRS